MEYSCTPLVEGHVHMYIPCIHTYILHAYTHIMLTCCVYLHVLIMDTSTTQPKEGV